MNDPIETVEQCVPSDQVHSDKDHSNEPWDEYKKEGIVIPETSGNDSNLVSYATSELKRAGLFDKDSDYAGNLGKGVLDLVKVFSAQGHSGFSAGMTIELFQTLASFKPLGKFEPTIEESMDVSEYSGEGKGKVLQSTRKCSVFSADGGKTWYDLDDKDWHYPE